MLLITLLNIAIFQGVILGIVILKSPIFKSKANKYLAFAIFSFSISLLNFVLEETGAYTNYPFLRFFDIIDSGLLFPIFLFLYVVHQVNHNIKNSKKWLWLFVPFLYSIVYDAIDEYAGGLSFLPKTVELILNLIQIPIILLFTPVLLIYTFTFIKFSDTPEEKKWLTYLLVLVSIFYFSWIFGSIIGSAVSEFLQQDIITPLIQVLTLFVAFLIYWISYMGIFKFRLAKDRKEIKTLLNKLNSSKPVSIEQKSPNSLNIKKGDTFTKDNNYFVKLEALCNDQHIYKDSTLDREKIATQLGISSGYVSQLINTVTGENFSTYINRYRVEAVKRIILDPEFDNYSLLAIGLECGFSSKTTFHNSFKKMTGMTPNAYRKKHK